MTSPSPETIREKLDKLEAGIATMEREFRTFGKLDELKVLWVARGVLAYAQDLEARIAALEARHERP